MKKIIMLVVILVVTFSVTLSAETSKGKTEWEDGIIHWRSHDGNFDLRLDTRIYINGAYFFDDSENILSNQTNLRKARFALKTRLWDVWKIEWDIDIAEADIVEIKDMFVSYIGFKNSHIKFGNFKQALGLEELTSSRYITFVERAYPLMAFETDRMMALEYSRWWMMDKTQLNFRGSLFGQTLAVEGEDDYEKEVDEDGVGAAGRLVLGQTLNENMLFHGGVAGVYNTPNDESEEMDFKSEPETKIGDIEFLDTGDIDEVDHCLRFGLEGAFQYKNIHLQGEYINTSVARLESSDKKDPTFSGGYGFISWVLTGERRPWSATDGEFGQIIPKSNKIGAWELAARYSNLDLNDEDADIYGGTANDITLGLNWYPNPNVKFQLNYTMVDQSQNANSDGDYNFGKDGYDFNYLAFMAVLYF